LKVVKATNSLDDIEALKSLAYEWKDTWNGKQFGIDLRLETHFKDLASLIENEDSELFLLMKKDRTIGYLGAICFDSPLGEQKFCQEHYWFVSTKNRGRGTLLLLRAFENWAKEKGCTHRLITASCLASDMHDRLCRFYEKIGFRKFETTYIEEL
jgi:GNAT superfamily N-acetyltransferase